MWFVYSVPLEYIIHRFSQICVHIHSNNTHIQTQEPGFEK